MRHSLRSLAIASTLVAASWSAGPALAHHSSFMYDMTKTVTIKGVVKQFQYTNPHSWLIVETKNPDGTMTSWGFEAEGPSTSEPAILFSVTDRPLLEMTGLHHE